MLVDSLSEAGVSTDWARASTAAVTTFWRIAATASEVTSWAERSALRTGRKATRSARSATTIPASSAPHDRRGERQAGEDVEGVGGEHDELAVGEVHHAHHRVDEGDAEGDQRIEAAEGEGVDQVLAQLGQRSAELEGELSAVGAVNEAGELERALLLRPLRPGRTGRSAPSGRDRRPRRRPGRTPTRRRRCARSRQWHG